VKSSKLHKTQEQICTFRDAREPVVVFFDIDLDDAGLGPYEFRAYQRIARRCAGASTGRCFESLQSMADGCGMSRAALGRAIRVLIERQMVARSSQPGEVSTYILLDKSQWLSLQEWQERKNAGSAGSNPAPTEPGTHLPESRGVTPREPGVAPTEPGGGSLGAIKNIKKKINKAEEGKDTLSAGAGEEGKKPLLSKHPMVEFYREISGFNRLNQVQIKQIATQITDATLLRTVLYERGLRGWHLGNVANTLKDYQALARGVSVEKLYDSPGKGHLNGASQKPIAEPDNRRGGRYESRVERNDRYAREYIEEVFGAQSPDYAPIGEPDGWGAEALDQAVDYEGPRRLSTGYAKS